MTVAAHALVECMFGKQTHKRVEFMAESSSSHHNDDDNNNNNNNNDDTDHDDTTMTDASETSLFSTITQEEEDFLLPPGHWMLSSTKHQIPLQQFRKLCGSQGIPDEGSHRGVAWRVLTGYLPPELSQWPDKLQQAREQYYSFVAELFLEMQDVQAGYALRGRRGRIIREEDTLRWDNQPQEQLPKEVRDYWKRKGRDLHILESLTRNLNALRIREPEVKQGESYQPNTSKSIDPNPFAFQDSPKRTIDESSNQASTDIVVDTKPSLPNLLDEQIGTENEETMQNVDSFGDIHEAPSAEVLETWEDFVESAILLDEIRKDVVRTHPNLSFFLEPENSLGRRRLAAVERILFVWSKFNKGVRYVQGMNEIVGTIYYVFANDLNEDWASNAEADTYWLFHILLSEMRDVFVPDLDNEATGIQGRIKHMEALLAKHDPEIMEHLTEVGIDGGFYAIRWWTTLLSREFLLPDTIRLWDSMFASTHKDNFLRYVCVTMVMYIREDLLKADFSKCLRLLQSYPSVQMDRLIESSRSLWVYESQITVACHRGGISLHQALHTIAPPPTIIMAFGLRHGIAPLTRAEQLEIAGERAATSVREATAAMAVSANGLLGRASRLYSRYSKEYSKKLSRRQSTGSHHSSHANSASSQSELSDKVDTVQRAKSVDAVLSSSKSSESKDQDVDAYPALETLSLDDDIYLAAILNA